MVSTVVSYREAWQPDPIHLSLEALFPVECANVWLAIDIEQCIVTKLQSQHYQRHDGQPRICCNRAMSPNSLRVFIPLLVFPECCPYAYLLAALNVSEEILIRLLVSPSDPLCIPFFDEAERLNDALQNSAPGAERELLMRNCRRIMTDTMAASSRLGLTIVSLRSIGYRIQPTVFPVSSPSRRSRNVSGKYSI